jgi:hypothetical protein
MRFEHPRTLHDYISDGDETTHQLVDQRGELIVALEEAYDFFAKRLWAGDPDLSPVAALLSMNAFMYFLSGVRLALTGHEVAIFPQLRTSLEAACYAYRMSKDKSLETVWLSRHDSPDAFKASRRAFQSAVADTAAAMKAIEPSYGALIKDAYDAAIDFGGHPNPFGLLQHLSFGDATEGGYQPVQIGALYGPESHYVKRALVACLDYAMALGIVLIHCLEKPSPEAVAALNGLNETKERIVQALQAA